MQKMTEFEVVTQELPWIQQIRTDLLELEPFDDFVSIFPLTALQELLDNKEKAKDFVEHDVSVIQKWFLSLAIPQHAMTGSATTDG